MASRQRLVVSATRQLILSTDDAPLAIYIPYPYYRDEALLEELTAHDGGTSVGRWVKKSTEIAEVALIISAANLLLGPAWRRVYEELVHPRLATLAEAAKARLLQRGASRVRTEFMQPVRCKYYKGTIGTILFPRKMPRRLSL